MFGKPYGNAQAYAKVGLESDLISASPHRLVAMLFEGADRALRTARFCIAQGDVAGRGHAIGRAIDIIGSGLMASLDLERGGIVATHLHALYAYMLQRLVTANLENRADIVDEVLGLLTPIREAWQQIGTNAAASLGDAATLAA